MRQQENKAKVVRKLCDCQAQIHPLIGNCLKCGKIICTREGEGPCLFCGSLEEKSENPNSDEIKKATEHRDKLIKYEQDRRITKVYGN